MSGRKFNPGRGAFRNAFGALAPVGGVLTAVFTLYALLQSVIWSDYIFQNDLSVDYAILVLVVAVSAQDLICLLGVPVLMLTAFSFLTKRSGSDFFHAYPCRRKTLFCAQVAAVLSWAGIMLGAAELIRIAVMLRTGFSFADMSVSGSLLYVAILFAMCLLGVGAFAIGISVTGTRLTNLMASVFLLYGPGFLVTFILSCLQNILVFVPMDRGVWSYVHVYNLCVGFFTGGSTPYEYYYSLYGNNMALTLKSAARFVPVSVDPSQYLLPLAYSMALGIVYMVIGGMLFVRRKSELAGRPSLNSILQSLFRMFPALICFLLGVMAVLDGGPEDQPVWFETIWWFAAGIAVYILYELVTSQRWKSALKSLIFIPIPIALSLVIGFGVSGIVRGEAEKTPSAEEISAVNLLNYGSDVSFQDFCAEIPLESKEVRNIVAEELSAEMNEFLSGASTGFQPYAEELSAESGEMESVSALVEIHYSGKSIYRYLSFEQTAYEKLVEELKGTKQFARFQAALPAPGPGATYYTSGAAQNLSSWQAGQLYEVMRQEASSLQDAYRLYMGESEIQGQFFGTVEMMTRDGSSSTFPVLADMKETVMCLSAMQNKRSAPSDFEQFVSEVAGDAMKGKEKQGAALEILCYTGGRLYGNRYWYGQEIKELEDSKLSALCQMLSGHEEQQISPDRDMVIVCFVVYGERSEKTGVRWYNLTPEETDALLQLVSLHPDYSASTF